LRPAVLNVVGRHADQTTWDKLHELGLKTQSIEEKGNFYDAMAAALSPELAKRTLPLSVTDEMPASQAVLLVALVATDGEQPEIAWNFAQTNREKLDAKLSALVAVRFVPYLMRGFSDARRATELETYAQKYMPAGAKSEVEKAAEEIRFNAGLKARIVPELREWLSRKRT
jgi:aminopeptidase N